ncbi:hypothetical protein PYCC9005_003136 [Savitreella phatthalungensis]
MSREERPAGPSRSREEEQRLRAPYGSDMYRDSDTAGPSSSSRRLNGDDRRDDRYNPSSYRNDNNYSRSNDDSYYSRPYGSGRRRSRSPPMYRRPPSYDEYPSDRDRERDSYRGPRGSAHPPSNAKDRDREPERDPPAHVTSSSAAAPGSDTSSRRSGSLDARPTGRDLEALSRSAKAGPRFGTPTVHDANTKADLQRLASERAAAAYKAALKAKSGGSTSPISNHERAYDGPRSTRRVSGESTVGGRSSSRARSGERSRDRSQPASRRGYSRSRSPPSRRDRDGGAGGYHGGSTRHDERRVSGERAAAEYKANLKAREERDRAMYAARMEAPRQIGTSVRAHHPSSHGDEARSSPPGHSSSAHEQDHGGSRSAGSRPSIVRNESSSSRHHDDGPIKRDHSRDSSSLPTGPASHRGSSSGSGPHTTSAGGGGGGAATGSSSENWRAKPSGPSRSDSTGHANKGTPLGPSGGPPTGPSSGRRQPVSHLHRSSSDRDHVNGQMHSHSHAHGRVSPPPPEEGMTAGNANGALAGGLTNGSTSTGHSDNSRWDGAGVRRPHIPSAMVELERQLVEMRRECDAADAIELKRRHLTQQAINAYHLAALDTKRETFKTELAEESLLTISSGLL